MEEFFLDDADYRKLDNEWKESAQAMRAAPEATQPRLNFVRRSLLLFCNTHDDQRAHSYRMEVLQRGMAEAEKCLESEKECLKMWVVMAKYFKEQPIATKGVSETFFKLKDRTGSLVQQYPGDGNVLELAGKVIMESRVPFWKRAFVSLPTPPDAAEAIPYFRKALEMDPSKRRHLYLADALYEAGQAAEAKEHFTKCAEMTYNENNALDCVVHNECSMRQNC
eukprot:TRINITY_DN4187_c1_g1_i1.p1 TRINITY_DN4187_c1_g1~~TRINITY_DN4187_c1_g1_i1.p1  ORF type:complete len:249 (+),score=119.89 TRINITY_DN4187_c1_g1_i1:80-748(+)